MIIKLLYITIYRMSNMNDKSYIETVNGLKK